MWVRNVWDNLFRKLVSWLSFTGTVFQSYIQNYMNGNYRFLFLISSQRPGFINWLSRRYIWLMLLNLIDRTSIYCKLGFTARSDIDHNVTVTCGITPRGSTSGEIWHFCVKSRHPLPESSQLQRFPCGIWNLERNGNCCWKYHPYGIQKQ